MVAELRAPTTDLCDLGLSVDPGTVFVSLYFAQILRESCLCFRYGRRICKRRCGSGTDTAWREGKKSTRMPTTQEQQQPAQGPQRFRMNSPEGGQGLPGGATAPYLYTSATESCQWLWKYARKSNWTARSFLHCADYSDSPDSVFEFDPGYG